MALRAEIYSEPDMDKKEAAYREGLLRADKPEAFDSPEVAKEYLKKTISPEQQKRILEAQAGIDEGDSGYYVREPSEEREEQSIPPDQAEKIMAEEAAPRLPENLQTLEKKNELGKGIWKKLQETKIFGAPADHLVAFGGAAAARMAVKYGLKAGFGLSGYALAAAGGGIYRGGREWLRGRKEQYSIASWIQELESMSGLDLAQKHQILGKALAGSKIKGDRGEIAAKMRDIETQLGISKAEEAAGAKDSKERIKRFLEERKKSFAATDLSAEAQKIFQDMLSARKKKVFWRVTRGALVGAAMGAAGAAAAEAVSAFAEKYMSDVTPQHAEAAAAKVRTLKDAAKGMLMEKRMALNELAMQKAMEWLPQREFVAHAEQGEGVTHLARKLIHDYLTEGNKLAPQGELTPAQLIYAEDSLRHMIGDKALALGEEVKVDGSKITDAIAQARGLAAEKLESIKQDYVGKVSGQAWEKVQNYDHIFDAGNRMAAEQAFEEAKANLPDVNVLEPHVILLFLEVNVMDAIM